MANKINYLIARNAFTSFPRVNMHSKEIVVGNFFLDQNKSKEKLNESFINILLVGGSAGSLDLNHKMLDEIMKFKKTDFERTKFFIQIPSSYSDISKKIFWKN